MNDPMLTINNLSVVVRDFTHERRLLEGVHLNIPSQSIVGLVGGSGSGKTTTGLSILRLLSDSLSVQCGEIRFLKEDILKASYQRMVELRGKEISMVFQEPLQAFNPVFTIGFQIEEVLLFHTALSPVQRHNKIHELLELVEINEPGRVAASYPHQLSGGMRQRAMIAQAIAAGPRLIIADEPTSNLDVTIQARIIDLFRRLRENLKLSILLITHDLGLVNHLCDQVYVMSKGKIVESGSTKEIMNNPKEDYTRQLLQAFT